MVKILLFIIIVIVQPFLFLLARLVLPSINKFIAECINDNGLIPNKNSFGMNMIPISTLITLSLAFGVWISIMLTLLFYFKNNS